VDVDYRRGRSRSSTRAVNELNLSVGTGTFVAIVGPSGCGKTTLLKVVDGQVPVSSGEVLVNGEPLERASQERAMVFQEALLLPWFNVLRNVAYGLEARRVAKRSARAKAKQYVNLVGLDGFENHYPHELSGGMQQRANLARALAVEPRLLLMDEPFSALDAQTREIMQQELLRIWSEAEPTVLFITHDIAEAVYLSDKVVVMSGRPGSIVEEISIDLPRPRELEVKRTSKFQGYEDRIWRLIEPQVRANALQRAAEGGR
jgi:NitT/TauT family transport system ATP-binding protein